jgi:glucose dehydrogenase
VDRVDEHARGRSGQQRLRPALVTASGLVFHGGTRAPVLRVHDVDTGARIATFDLPAGLHAGPISYKLAPDHKQFLVVAPGGHSESARRSATR